MTDSDEEEELSAPATMLLSSSGLLVAVDLALRPVLWRIMAISCSSKMEMNEIMKNEK